MPLQAIAGDSQRRAITRASGTDLRDDLSDLERRVFIMLPQDGRIPFPASPEKPGASPIA
jgi:hypothetical protein